MRAKLINEASPKTYVLVFETGEEVMKSLLAFAREKKLASSRITAIGAFREVTLGYFDWSKKKYQVIPLSEQVELVSLMGDVALDEKGEPQLHVHVVVAKSDGTAHGGHLIEAIVRPTMELILVESPSHLQRRHDSQSGLALIRV